MIRVSDEPIDAATLVREFEKHANGAGGIVTFSGLVRPEASGGTVKTLHLQAYPEMTVSGIQAALDEANARWPLNAAWIVHRTGDMAPGDTIVFVAAASAHRRAAFEAADFLMDYLKTKAVFWKREDTGNSSVWIEPRTEDYSDAERWSPKQS